MKVLLCASSRALSDTFRAMARDIGHHIGQSGHVLVYGGGDVGLMGEAAKAAAEAGGAVKGYVPAVFQKVAPHQPHTSVQTDVVQTIFERKEKMLLDADILVALPGGIGTLDEITEGAVANDVQCYADDSVPFKPIVILNALDDEGVPYFNALKAMLEDCVRKGAMDEARLKMFHFVETADEAAKLLDHYTAQGIPPAASLKPGWNSPTLE